MSVRSGTPASKPGRPHPRIDVPTGPHYFAAPYPLPQGRVTKCVRCGKPRLNSIHLAPPAPGEL